MPTCSPTPPPYAPTPWAQRMYPHLERLAAKTLRDRHYSELHSVARLLDDLGIVWSRMLDENRERYLVTAQSAFHPRALMGEIYADDPDYRAICELLDAELREVRRRR